MAGPTSTAADKQQLMLDTGRRRSMRVLLSVPIHVSGKTKTNQDFDEETRTLVVNAHGALISLAAKVVAGQDVTLSNSSTQSSIGCRIVYLGNPTSGKVQMGIEFLSPCPSFWQIDFPPDDWVVPEN
ncbi:MAG TPA: PilZ domain-containing protein [Verrucomicrobiae bacterium]|nr:PilZ domain-containing protein [Verrucomicrobiae bacterium]